MSLLLNHTGAPLLCYVTERSSLPAAIPGWESLATHCEAAAAAGIDCIQIREKDLSGADCAALTRMTMHRTARFRSNAPRTKILVNDRLDVALSEKTAGVHLGEQSLPVAAVRRTVGEQGRSPFLIGVSCHSLEAAREGAAAGADYLFFGPVFATPSKASFGPPQGTPRLAEVCHAVRIPVFAIGGITLQNAQSCLVAGAAGLAAIRLFQDSADLPALVRALHNLRRS